MKQYIKSYDIFFSGKILQIFTYFIYPILLIAIAVFMNIFDYIEFIGLFIIGTLIISIEGYIDYNVFGGFAKKDTNRLEYMKSSVKCSELVKKGLVMDAVRRYLYITIIIIMSSFILDVSLEITICILAVTYFINTITLFIERFFNNMMISYILIYAIVIIYSILVFSMINRFKFQELVILSVVIIILSIAITCFNIWFLIKRMKEAYYDE